MNFDVEIDGDDDDDNDDDFDDIDVFSSILRFSLRVDEFCVLCSLSECLGDDCDDLNDNDDEDFEVDDDFEVDNDDIDVLSSISRFSLRLDALCVLC